MPRRIRAFFSSVTRLRLAEVPGALKCILWGRRAQRIISVAEYRQSEDLQGLPRERSVPWLRSGIRLRRQ